MTITREEASRMLAALNNAPTGKDERGYEYGSHSAGPDCEVCGDCVCATHQVCHNCEREETS